jgi:lactoylglutathione lyase
MTAKLTYVIKFVKNMDAAVKFYRDTLGLPLKFESPGWSEFVTGEVALALHPASDKNPSGKMELGFNVEDLPKFYEEMRAKGLRFTMPPTEQDFGRLLAQFLDSEDSPCSVGSS